MPKNTLIDELSIAYKTEMNGYGFYKHAAEMTKDEHGRNVFNHLASEELEHIDVITGIIASLKGSGSWKGYKEAKEAGAVARGTKALSIFPDENELIKKLKKNPTDDGAIAIAIESEEHAVAFYDRMLRDEAETPEQKVFLTNLLEMEKGHLKLLRWEHEALIKNGFWCDFMEFSVEKETR